MGPNASGPGGSGPGGSSPAVLGREGRAPGEVGREVRGRAARDRGLTARWLARRCGGASGRRGGLDVLTTLDLTGTNISLADVAKIKERFPHITNYR